MRGIDLFCASPASTAIRAAMDRKPMVCSGGRAIDRHNPHLLDSRRIKQSNPPSQSPPDPATRHHRSRRGSVKEIELASPPGSSRYLLSHPSVSTEPPPLESDQFPVPEFILMEDLADSVPSLIRMETEKPESVEEHKLPTSNSKPPSATAHDQVVVLRVSLHCKGCEHKVRKHISRMQGVRSFNIDFTAKKVTVAGRVTPLGVLERISKVKKAQLLQSP